MNEYKIFRLGYGISRWIVIAPAKCPTTIPAALPMLEKIARVKFGEFTLTNLEYFEYLGTSRLPENIEEL